MKVTKTGKWTISQDEEYWDSYYEFNSKEDAIKFGKTNRLEGFPHEDFYVGQIYSIEFDGKDLYDPSERIIEELSDCLYDEVGDCSENWYNSIAREMEEDLNKMINETVLKWIENNKLQPSCFKIDDVELIRGDYEYEEDD